jgi:hypothetical protein
MSTKTVSAAGAPPGYRFRRFPIGSIDQTQTTFAQVLRRYARGELEDNYYRGLVWGLSQYLGVLKLQRELDLDERLETLERAIEANAKTP